MTRPVLDDRHRRILKFVVESHVVSAEPVGSQYVRVAYHLSISPATIRNAMNRLEEMGFLDHPHTSAGRLPTEEGYRYYVDELMRPAPLPAGMRRAVDTALRAGRARGEELETVAARTLAQAARQLGLVAVRARSLRPIGRIELVALEDGLVLLAVGAEEGPLATASWRPVSRAELAWVPRADRWIRSRLPVAGSAGIRALAGAAAREAPRELRAYLGDVLARAGRLVDARDTPAFRMEGADHVASQPEFQSAARLRLLVSLLAEQGSLTRALDSFTELTRPRVSIGSENGPGAIRDCSLVGCGIEIDGNPGSIGILGPVRMPYPRLVSLVAYLSGRLARGAA